MPPAQILCLSAPCEWTKRLRSEAVWVDPLTALQGAVIRQANDLTESFPSAANMLKLVRAIDRIVMSVTLDSPRAVVKSRELIAIMG